MLKPSTGRRSSHSHAHLDEEDHGKPTARDTAYYLTMMMHSNKHDRERNRKISEMLATHELLSMGGTDSAHDKNPKSKSRSHSKNRSRKNLLESRTNRTVKQNKVNIIHGVYNRNQNASEQNVKKQYLDRDPQGQNQRESSRNGRNMSNFQRLKMEVEQLEKSNIVLGQKEQNMPIHRASSKELKIKDYSGVNNAHTNPSTRTQRYRYKQNISNRSKAKNTDKNTTMGDFQTYYRHINSQIINKSAHKLSTEGDVQAEQMEAEYSEVVRKGSMKGHYKSASQWNISKKLSKTHAKTEWRDDPPYNSYPLKEETAGQEQHLIRNQFIPMVNRSVLDKNRHNIKKISRNMNRILSSKLGKNAEQGRCVTMGDQVTNQNIEQFVRTKKSILDITGSLRQLNFNASTNKGVGNMDIMKVVTNRKQQTTRRQATSNRKQCHSHSQILKSTGKIETSNAAKFYRPQFEKYKGKSNVMIVDPHLKAKAMHISSKKVKKNNDIVIICL